jgi:hypothetical protein
VTLVHPGIETKKNPARGGAYQSSSDLMLWKMGANGPRGEYRAASALPLIADLNRMDRHFRKVPTPEVGATGRLVDAGS